MEPESLPERWSFLSQTNSLPSISERTTVLKEIGTTQGRLDDLDAQINRLLSKRWDVQCQFDQLTQVVSPIRRLSRDVVHVLLLAFVEAEIADESITMPKAPWVASWVCQAWREVALSNPSLWVSIYIMKAAQSSLPGVLAHIERSRGWPLSVNVKSGLNDLDSEADAVPKLLAEHSHRWKNLLATDVGLNRILYGKDIHPRLLRHLDLRGGLRELFWLLNQCHMLETAILVINDFTDIPSINVHNENLVKLSLFGRHSSSAVSRLDLPSLLELEMDSGLGAGHDIFPPLHGFLTRSSAPLASLKLFGGRISDDSLILILEKLPALVKLSMRSVRGLMQEYIRGMTDHPSGCLLPQLRDVTLPLCSPTIDFVRSRMREQEKVAKLQRLDIQPDGSAVPEALVEELLGLVDRGEIHLVGKL
ncbi:hypothetical protein ONZ45_g13573 [Pleurotus djamor]|nr:hypothetical protein ONZ45_g13573 [Pleurotus djamor]